MTYEYPEEVIRAHNEEVAHTHRENMALQEMLAHVLNQVGSPIYINKEDLAGGKFEGKRIDIQDNAEANRFELSLVDDV